MNPNITWQVIAHTLVGMTIAGTQAAALAFPSDAMLVAICHITAVVVAQLGIGLGVWTVSTGAATRKALMAANCNSCGKPAFAPPPADPPAPETKAAA